MIDGFICTCTGFNPLYCISYTLFGARDVRKLWRDRYSGNRRCTKRFRESASKRPLGLVYEAVPHPSRSDCVNLPPDCGPYAVRTVPHLPLKLYFWGLLVAVLAFRAVASRCEHSLIVGLSLFNVLPQGYLLVYYHASTGFWKWHTLLLISTHTLKNYGSNVLRPYSLATCGWRNSETPVFVTPLIRWPDSWFSFAGAGNYLHNLKAESTGS